MNNVGNIKFTIDKTVQNVVQLLKERKLKLATAESCTGGLLSGAVTSVPGSSAVFEYGFCTYANAAKIKLLGVNPETLENFGAVSSETAVEMEKGARLVSGADIAVSVTGIASPIKDSSKPAGLVWFCCNGIAEQKNFTGGREAVRLQSVLYALNILQKELLK
jgi:PncC family amidohydrolase